MTNYLITGGTGFLGKYIVEAVTTNHLNNVYLLCRNNLNGSLLNGNIFPIFGSLNNFKLDNLQNINCVIHAAGLAHKYPKNNEEEKRFYDVNLEGTVNLTSQLNAHSSSLKRFIFISTVAVYGKDYGHDISETTATEPTTPYGKSKLLAENHIVEWCKERSIPYFIFRLPLIVGENPPGNLGKMISRIKNKTYIRIKNNNASKSLVLASDIGNFILNTSNSNKSGIYNLTDRVNATFSQIEEAIISQSNKHGAFISIPKLIIKYLCVVGDLFNKIGIYLPINSSFYNKLTSDLTFSSSKASEELNWQPIRCLTFFYKKNSTIK